MTDSSTPWTSRTPFKSDLLDLADFASQRLRTRLDGLSDEEYLWEPAAGCWSVRPGDDGRWHRDPPKDGAVLPPDPAPLTTIAWRLCHIIDDVLGADRNATWLGSLPRPRPDRQGEPGTADAARAELDEAYGVFRGYIEAADEAELDTAMGPIAGPYAESSRASFVLHEIDELIHHGAEIGVLRDLYRATRPADPFVAACVAGDRTGVEARLDADPSLRERYPNLVTQTAAAQQWDILRLLLDRGFGVQATTGTPAVHYAAGAGPLDVVRLLVERGSDHRAKDPTYSETALGWARHFGREDVAEYLAGLS